MRDLRFTLAAETAWKAARAALLEGEGMQTPSGSPKAMVRASVLAGWLDERQGEAALHMMNDRNLTVHTYDEALAQELFARFPRHADLIGAWLAAMRAALARR